MIISKLASLSEIIRYFKLENKIDPHNLTQGQIIYLLRRYYAEQAKSSNLK